MGEHATAHGPRPGVTRFYVEPGTRALLPSCALDDADNTQRLLVRLGRYLRQLRTTRGMTQEALAERCGLSCDAVRRVEGGRCTPSLETLSKLAGGLEMSLSTLFIGLEQGRGDETEQICDYLRSRTRNEQRLAWRVLRALFDDDSRRTR